VTTKCGLFKPNAVLRRLIVVESFSTSRRSTGTARLVGNADDELENAAIVNV
jgi:hypothetical protein